MMHKQKSLEKIVQIERRLLHEFTSNGPDLKERLTRYFQFVVGSF